MSFSTRLLVKAGAVGLMLVASVVPLSHVSAHECKTAISEAPVDPDDADTGCNGSSCPADSGTLPHRHYNGVPSDGPWYKECQSGDGGKRATQKNGNGRGTPGGGPNMRAAGVEGARLAEAPWALFATECIDGVDNDWDGGTDWLGTAHGGFQDWDSDCTWPGDPSESAGDDVCVHPSSHSHTYAFGGSLDLVGLASVIDTNAADCDQDGLPGDYDGDYDAGIGGAFFGYGPWASEPTCDYGLRTHGGSVFVHDMVWGSNIAFAIGADDTSGPVISTDPITGETTCETDGSITAGDPETDPTADADDCLHDALSWGVTCGAGGDGGYWVFLDAHPPSNPPTVGIITA
jgi:hypothetical protein